MLLRSGIRFFNLSKLLRPNISQALLKQCLHLSAVPCAKRFHHAETEFNYKFVQNYETQTSSEKSKQTEDEFKLEASYDRKSPEELIRSFNALSYHCQQTESCISSERYDGIVDNLIKEAPNFDDDQLMQLLVDLERFPQTSNAYSRNFLELWKALDEESCQRLRMWKNEKILQMCNLWLKLTLSKIGDFTGKALMKIFRRIDRLPTKVLVETMFYLTVCRIKIPMFQVELRFDQVFDELNINEIGIMSLAFFKTETKVKMFSLIDKMYDATCKNADTIPDITLVNILKTLRYSSDPTHARKLTQLSDALLPRVESLSLIACLHIGLLGTNLQYCHQGLFEAIVTRFNRDLKKTRLKDIERISFALGLFDFKAENGVEKELLKNVVSELKSRVKEIMMYPKCLAANAHYLTVCGVHDEEIIKSVLKEEFISFAYGKNAFKIGREILCLDSFTRINLRDSYNGPQLSDQMRANITKFQTHYVPYRGQKYKLTHSDQLTLDMKEFLEQKYGANKLIHILPHFERPDIVYCFDQNGKSVTEEILDCFPPHFKGNILSKEFILSKKPEFAECMNNYQMLAFIIGGWNFYLRETHTPTGVLRMKMEQLEMIGYKPILVHWNDWMRMSLNEKDKLIESEVAKALSSHLVKVKQTN